MCVLVRKAALSNSALPTRCPLPVLSRSRSAARAAMTPNMAPLTDAPARSGRPAGPVMKARPVWNCDQSPRNGPRLGPDAGR